jgi:hypothetical protein
VLIATLSFWATTEAMSPKVASTTKNTTDWALKLRLKKLNPPKASEFRAGTSVSFGVARMRDRISSIEAMNQSYARPRRKSP